MNDLLPPWPLLTAFLAASLVLAVTPGPGVLYIVTRSVVQGRRSGLLSVAAVAAGNLACAWGAALGLAAVFAASSQAASIVRLAGAAYLVWLGVQMLRTRSDPRAHTPPVADARRIVRDGMIVAVLNPKTIIFFAAFLPQFLAPDAARPALQAALLGAVFVAIAALTDSVYAWTAGSMAPVLTRAHRLRGAGRLGGGLVFIALGLYAAWTGSRAPADRAG